MYYRENFLSLSLSLSIYIYIYIHILYANIHILYVNIHILYVYREHMPYKNKKYPASTSFIAVRFEYSLLLLPPPFRSNLEIGETFQKTLSRSLAL
jgi:hypothetical protein